MHTPFTTIMIGVRCVALALPTLTPIAHLLAVFVFVSFHTGIVADPTVVGRMCRSRGWSRTIFHVGNFVLHILPFLDATSSTDCAVRGRDMVTTISIFAMWASYQAHPFRYDEAYVPLEPWVWCTAIVAGVAGAVLLWRMR